MDSIHLFVAGICGQISTCKFFGTFLLIWNVFVVDQLLLKLYSEQD